MTEEVPNQNSETPKRKPGRPRKPRPSVGEIQRRERRNKIVEQCRVMLNMNFTRGDIKRMLADKYSMHPSSIDKYMSLARARNRQRIDKDDLRRTGGNKRV